MTLAVSTDIIWVHSVVREITMKAYFEEAHVHLKVRGFPTNDLDVAGCDWWGAPGKHMRQRSGKKRRNRTRLNKRARQALKRDLVRTLAEQP